MTWATVAPSQERELKSHSTATTPWMRGVAPSQERELKYARLAGEEDGGLVAPSQERELKLTNAKRYGENESRSFTGA